MAIILPNFSDELLDSSTALDVRDKIVRLTRQLFNCDPRIDVVTDPEFGDRCFQFSVESDGTVEQLLALNDRWHREVRRIAGSMTRLYCLSLIPRDEPD